MEEKPSCKIKIIMKTLKSYGRQIGVLYLVLIGFGVFAQFYVRGNISENPVAYITENETLFRVGFLSDIIMQLCYLFIGIRFYFLFKEYNKRHAFLLILSVAIAVALMVGNMLNYYEPLLMESGPSKEQMLFALSKHQQGYLLAQLFFGLWLIPLGQLIRKSTLLPAFIGFMLMLGGVSYLVDFVLHFMTPERAEIWCNRITLPADLAEFWLCVYLLIFGFRENELTIKQIQEL